MNPLCKSIALASICALVSACATTNFYPHESRDNTYVGKGGARFATEGIDVWFIGEPDRQYTILGYIEDSFNSVVDERHQYVSSGVLKKAHEIGANALIEVITATQTTPSGGMWSGGMFGSRYSGMGMGFGMSLPLSEQRNARYTAIKYLE